MGLRMEGKGDEYWVDLLGRLTLPEKKILKELGWIPGHVFVDPNIAIYADNSISSRTSLISGLILAAEDSGLIGIDLDHKYTPPLAIAVIGNGVTALIGISLALVRGIPVLHITSDEVKAPLAAPLISCTKRWVAPTFYRRCIGGNLSDRWAWRPPVFSRKLESDETEKILSDEFNYGHEAASTVGARWLASFNRLRRKYSALYYRLSDPGKERKKSGLLHYHSLVEKGADELRAREISDGVGLVISCRLASQEKNAATSDGAVVYRSAPYWDPLGFEPWMTHSHQTVISGGGDAGLQDFLRIAWNWTELVDARDVYRELRYGVTEFEKVTDRLDEIYDSFADMKAKWEDERLEKLDGDAVTAEILSKINKKRVTDLERYFHVLVRRRVAVLLPHLNRKIYEYFDGLGKLIVLRTSAEEFHGCNAHNHFFTLLTLGCLARRTKRLICALDEFAVYHGIVPSDTADYSKYILGGLGDNIEVAGHGRTDLLLIRHGIELARL